MHANLPFVSGMPRAVRRGAGLLATGPHGPANRRDAPMRSPFAPLGMSLRRLLDRLAAIDAELRLRARLERLDERTLLDVGLTRAEIAAEIRRHPRLDDRSVSDPRADPEGGIAEGPVRDPCCR